MQVRLHAIEQNRKAIAPCCDATDMQRLRNIAGEVRNELDGICTSGIRTTLQLSNFGVLDTSLQNLGLVGERTDDATALRTITVVMDVAEAWRLIRGVNPVPARRVSPLRSIPIGVCPCTHASEAALVFGL